MAILFAVSPDWQDNPGAYQFTATIVGGIVLNINGEQMGECDNLNSNGECIDEIQDCRIWDNMSIIVRKCQNFPANFH